MFAKRAIVSTQDSHPSSSRRGISLLEVLISMFVLSIGVLGVAALIPLGKIAMLETEKADRTGACGRAALREAKIRRMLDPIAWASAPSNNVFVIDPLGYVRLNSNRLGADHNAPLGIERINLQTFPGSGVAINTVPQAESIFLWRDDLAFAAPKDPSSGQRPTQIISAGGERQVEGNFSWFLTVAATPGEAGLNWNQRRQFNVSAVVCHKRVFTNPSMVSGAEKPGEMVVPNVVCDSADGYGGIGIEFATPANLIEVKRNEWVLLNSTTQTTWYRVVHVGQDGANTRMTLVGPDWHGGAGGTSGSPDGTVSLVIVEGVTGVYTTTIQRDNDGIWTK